MLNPILLTLLVFGLGISYYDIKKGKIKNLSILALILVAIFINIFLTKSFINFPLASLLNILLAAIIGIIIWLGGVWSAADTKLFVALNFLFPVNFYQTSYGHFPGFFILLNSSVPLFLFLFIQLITKTSFREIKKALSFYLRPIFILKIFLAGGAMLCLSSLIQHFLKISIDYPVWLVVLFTLFWLVERKIKMSLSYFFAIVILFSLLLTLLSDLPLMTPNYLISVVYFSLMVFLLFVLLSLGESVFTRSVKIANLKEGMIPAEMIVKEGGRFVKKPITFASFLILLRQGSMEQPLVGFNPDGLEKEEIAQIHSLSARGLLVADGLKVSLVIPFAPVLFLGGLLTYFFHGSLYNIINIIINH